MNTILKMTTFISVVSSTTTAVWAESEWEFDFQGSIQAEATYDFEASPNDLYDVDLVEDDGDDYDDIDDIAKWGFEDGLVEDEDDVEGTNMDIDLNVKHGPLSATLSFELQDEESPFEEGYGYHMEWTIEDIIVTDRRFSFGQVGNLMETDEYTAKMGELDSETKDQTLGVDVGFRYEVIDGLKLQVQGTEHTKYKLGVDSEGNIESVHGDYNEANRVAYVVSDARYSAGFAAQYDNAYGPLSYIAEFEIAGSGASENDGFDPEFFLGTGVTYQQYGVTLKAGLNAFRILRLPALQQDVQLEYGLQAKTILNNTMLRASYTEFNNNQDDDELLSFDIFQTIDEFVLGLGYDWLLYEDLGNDLQVSFAWKPNSWMFKGSVELNDTDAKHFQKPLFQLDVSYQSEAGVIYYAGYDFKAQGHVGYTADYLSRYLLASTANNAQNDVTFGAKYSF